MSTTIFYPDIFNDVYGPIIRVHIILDKNGSFAGTFGHMNEDLGMLAGAYGLLPDDERLFDIKRNFLYSKRRTNKEIPRTYPTSGRILHIKEVMNLST